MGANNSVDSIKTSRFQPLSLDAIGRKDVWLAEKGHAVYERADNEFAEPRGELTSLVVWGGFVGNAGEKAVSKIVFDHRQTLRRVLYVPHETKRAKLVQPLRWNDPERRESFNREQLEFQIDGALETAPTKWVEFPSMCVMGMDLRACATPQHFGWLCPNLLHLTLFYTPLARHLHDTDLDAWLDAESPESLVCLAKRECPLLQSVLILRTDPRDPSAANVENAMRWPVYELALSEDGRWIVTEVPPTPFSSPAGSPYGSPVGALKGGLHTPMKSI